MDHLCGLPRAVFTLQQHPAGFLFTPENPTNRNLGTHRRVYTCIIIYKAGCKKNRPLIALLFESYNIHDYILIIIGYILLCVYPAYTEFDFNLQRLLASYNPCQKE